MSEANCTPVTATGSFFYESGAAGVDELLQQEPGLTAIFAMSDEMGAAVVNELQRRGLRVPEDVSVLGFDNTSTSLHVNPPLSTMAQPLEEMGRMAVKKLLRSRGLGPKIMPHRLIVAGTTTVFALVLGVFAAYAISRLNFGFKSVILGVIIATSMFPGISVVVPLLRLFTDIGWINTYQAMIVPNLSFAIPLAVWNLTTFMKALPFDLEEAAMIDGCTKWQAFRRVLLPLAAPGVFTTAILTFIHSWNEFIIALSMINDPKIQTATVAISKFTGATEFQAPFGEQMAAGVIVTVPLVIMVLIFQRRIVEGLTAGASK